MSFAWADSWLGADDPYKYIQNVSTGKPQSPTVWHGLVVDDDGILAQQAVEVEPTVNDMADLLAKALRRPWDETPRRPRTLRIRKRYEWQELLPHLRELVEQVVSAPRLAKWDKAFKEFCRSMAELGSERHPPEAELHHPAIAKWVRENGWIEIDDQEGSGFIVRALNSGGMVLADGKAKTLARALSVLEKGLEKHLGPDGVARPTEGSVPRRFRHDRWENRRGGQPQPGRYSIPCPQRSIRPQCQRDSGLARFVWSGSAGPSSQPHVARFPLRPGNRS